MRPITYKLRHDIGKYTNILLFPHKNKTPQRTWGYRGPLSPYIYVYIIYYVINYNIIYIIIPSIYGLLLSFVFTLRSLTPCWMSFSSWWWSVSSAFVSDSYKNCSNSHNAIIVHKYHYSPSLRHEYIPHTCILYRLSNVNIKF